MAKSSTNASLADKHVVITGGGRGIGAAIANQFDQLGAKITLMGRTEKPLAESAQTLSHGNYQLADVTDRNSVTQAFADARKIHGRVSVLVNNAGAARSAPFEKTSEALWADMLGVNLTGIFHCQQQVIDEMREANWGRIINIVSTAGLLGYAYVSAYCAAKHGAIGLTRALALETARDGITVNAVCPGFTETDLLEDSIRNIMTTTGRDREAAEKSLKAVNPQRRFIQPEEVAAMCGYLCGPGAESITGQALAIAGGEVM
ncbi:MAG: SDR family NAD(P)-dependent oxidoreductase [Gammaproteobacteria bacterium]